MQIISKKGTVFCVTKSHYTAEIVREMKKAGYTVKEMADTADPCAAPKKSTKGASKK